MKIKNKIKLYAELVRFQQPTGIFLLLWPCLIGLAIAGKGEVDLKLTLIFTLGSFLMRSAGCIFNDFVDINFDQKVERTKDRSIASGKISKFEATTVLITLLVASASLLLFLNKIAICIALFSVVLVVIYPFCKRFTYWPQLFLGFTFNIGVLIAWAEVRGSIGSPAIYLYIALIFWTLGYDTIYAHQDIKDDLNIGVKSTAIRFGDKTTKYLKWFYTITMILFIFAVSLAGVSLNSICLSVFPLILLFWQVRTLDIENKENCSLRFKSNVLVGFSMFLAITLPRLLS